MARDLLFIVTIGVSARLWRQEVHKMVARGGRAFVAVCRSQMALWDHNNPCRRNTSWILLAVI